MTIVDEWLQSMKIAHNANRAAHIKYEEAKEKAIRPKNLRPAQPEDIFEGAILWVDGDDGFTWLYVDEVHNQHDTFKGFTAEDGCRYGLHDMYVEVKDAE